MWDLYHLERRSPAVWLRGLTHNPSSLHQTRYTFFLFSVKLVQILAQVRVNLEPQVRAWSHITKANRTSLHHLVEPLGVTARNCYKITDVYFHSTRDVQSRASTESTPPGLFSSRCGSARSRRDTRRENWRWNLPNSSISWVQPPHSNWLLQRSLINRL